MTVLSERTPTLFLSHGAPPLADDTLWTDELARVAAGMARPKAILVVSAHWESAPLTIGATRTVALYYDFYGFPQRYYQVTYPAPGAPALARRLRKLLGAPGRPVHEEPDRGLDHGAYVPLVEMYPDADIPVLQVSMPTLDPVALLEVGKRLAPLRDEGVLIIGSGFTTHNLRLMDPRSSEPPSWSVEFDHWMDEVLTSRDYDDLVGFTDHAPRPDLAHPTTEHFAPVFVALGAALEESSSPETLIDGFWWGLSKRTVRFG